MFKRRKVIWACATCGRTPKRHNTSCLCQSFTWLDRKTLMRAHV